MMTDPYKVLNVDPSASDAEVKKAYRELARKYHPDHYHGTDLEHMAEEKMKEINEAYEMIQKQRKGGGQSGGYSGYGYGNYGGYRSGSSTDPLFQQVRAAINRGDLAGAEQMLNRTDLRNAEWHFLMGSIYYRRGWLDEAAREYETACAMEPNNMEYQQAYRFMRGGGAAYRPEGFGSGSMMECNWCQTMICASLMCSCCTGGHMHFCCL